MKEELGLIHVFLGPPINTPQDKLPVAGKDDPPEGDDLPDFPLPQGLEVRAVLPEHYRAIWDADIKAFKGSATFIMIGNWSIKIKVHNNVNDHDGVGETPFTVIAKTETQLFSFTNTADGLKYFVALVSPKNPKVGLNDFEVTVYL